MHAQCRLWMSVCRHRVSSITGASSRPLFVRLSVSIFDLLDQTTPGKLEVTPQRILSEERISRGNRVTDGFVLFNAGLADAVFARNALFHGLPQGLNQGAGQNLNRFDHDGIAGALGDAQVKVVIGLGIGIQIVCLDGGCHTTHDLPDIQDILIRGGLAGEKRRTRFKGDAGVDRRKGVIAVGKDGLQPGAQILRLTQADDEIPLAVAGLQDADDLERGDRFTQCISDSRPFPWR